MPDPLMRAAENALLSPVARTVRRRHLTYLTARKLRRLESALRRVRQRKVPGDFLEFGVALGGSAIVIASRLEPDRAFHGYDVFGMIPAPGPADDARSHQRYDEIRSGRSAGLGGDVYYGYVDDLFGRVCRSMAQAGLAVDGRRVTLHRGLFEQTLDPGESRPVAFVHIDCDWHDPVSYCLDAVYHRLSPGAELVLDDYNDYGGCRRAVDAFVGRHRDMRFLHREPNAVLTRTRAAPQPSENEVA